MIRVRGVPAACPGDPAPAAPVSQSVGAAMAAIAIDPKGALR
jgi:hypothetical protein